MLTVTAGTENDVGNYPARILPQLGEIVSVAFIIAVLIVGAQLKSHCYFADLREDEASHYISGLVIRDYLISDLGSSPTAFIKNFHSHYPLVGIGHWGPVYYFVEALWMLVFSTSILSVMALSATVTMMTALGIYAYARQMAGRWPALFAACAFVIAPLVEVGTSELMLDIPIALLCLGATYAYARYLERQLMRDSVAFALIASAALLIKGNAACLALLPPFAMLFARRLDLLRQVSFWLPVPIVAVLVGPWYVLTYGIVAVGFRYQWGLHYVVTAITANGASLLDSLGPFVLTAALLGAGVTIATAWARRAAPLPIAACALLFADWVFQSVTPAAIEARYLAPLLPPLLILAAGGVTMTAAWLKRHFQLHMSAADAGLALMLVLTVVPSAIAEPVKLSLGFVTAAREVWAKLPTNNRAVLIASNGLGEGAAIAALAMYDPARPSLFVVRGSRLLGGGGYNNEDYKPRFETVNQVMTAIDNYAIPLMLFHPNFPHSTPWLHVYQVGEAVRLEPARWKQILHVPSIDSDVILYGIRGNENKPSESKRIMELSMPSRLSDP